jgi:hypothetical protein
VVIYQASQAATAADDGGHVPSVHNHHLHASCVSSQGQHIAAFQEASGGGGGDLLPGVCHLAHEVLVDVQLPQYRCCGGVRAPLTHWFDNRNVAAQLQARCLHACLCLEAAKEHGG